MTLKRDTHAFLDLCHRLLSAGHRVRFRAHGTSMGNAIRDGELITVEPVQPSAVRCGDVLLFHQSQRPVAHRVVSIDGDSNRVVQFIVRGDAKKADDAPVKPDQILGRVLLPENNFRQRLWSHLWRRSA